MFKHFVQTQDISLEDLNRLMFHARNLQIRMNNASDRKEIRRKLKDKFVLVWFYEKSTRTGYSFVMATEHLGGRAHYTPDAGITSSAAKGETFEHTVRMLAGYRPDVLVIRHTEAGQLTKAAHLIDRLNLPIHVINAGDGPGQHPTQALLDIYTIQQCFGRMNGLRIMMGGDLRNGRTVRSLAYLLSKYDDVEIVFAAPNELQIGSDILDHLKEAGVTTHLADADYYRRWLPGMHVVYWTRLQEHLLVHDDPETQLRLREELKQLQREHFCIGRREMACMRNNAILMHPLPINAAVREIAREVEDDHRCVIFKQAENGMYVRMALLDVLLNGWNA